MMLKNAIAYILQWSAPFSAHFKTNDIQFKTIEFWIETIDRRIKTFTRILKQSVSDLKLMTSKWI